MQATPTTWQLLRESGWQPAPTLRVLCGGESLPQELADFLGESAAQVFNLYGPTETTVWSMIRPLTRGEPPSLGRPIRNTQVYLLDANLKPVSPGTAGEIYIAGSGLARGYLGQAALTSERFVANPYGPPGSRMYRTGDTARWKNDDTLRFLGRNDGQVKLRGHRIELGEIEACIAAHPDVAQAVVSLRQDGHGVPLLVAHVAPRSDAACDELAVRRFLAARLPNYMLPASIVSVGSMPLTPSGKIDRAALPAPQPIARGHDRPSDTDEQSFARFFEAILYADCVGSDDNFFDLGGDSVRAIRLVHLARAHGYMIDPADVFRAQTVSELAAVAVSNAGRAARDQVDVLLPLSTGTSARPLFCFHPKEGIGWPFASLVPHLTQRPVYALQSPLLSEANSSPSSIEKLAQEYLAEIRSVQPTGPYNLLGWSFGGLVAYCAADQLLKSGEAIGVLAMLDVEPSLDNNSHNKELPASRAQLDLDSTLRANLDRIGTHHVQLMANYTPPQLPVDILFFSSNDQAPGSKPKHARWQELTGKPTVVWHLNCEHNEMLDAKQAASIAKVLTPYLT